MNPILIAAEAEVFHHCRALADRFGCGLEVQEFAYAQALDGDWEQRAQTVRRSLAGLPGPVAIHGPAFDLNPGSLDRRLVALTRERYLTALSAASLLGAKAMILHTGFNPMIRNPGAPDRWMDRQVPFWQGVLTVAQRLEVQIYLENLWEPEPEVVRRLLDRVNSPQLGACLDVGHVHVFSGQPVEAWIETLGPHLGYTHLHNNDGQVDWHWGLTHGTLDAGELLRRLTALPQPVTLCLEIEPEELEDSLQFLVREGCL